LSTVVAVLGVAGSIALLRLSVPAHPAQAAPAHHAARSENSGPDNCSTYAGMGRGGTFYFNLGGWYISPDPGNHPGPGRQYPEYYACSDTNLVHGWAYDTVEAWCGTGSHIVAWHFWYRDFTLNVDGPAFRGVYEDHVWATAHNWDLFHSSFWRIVLKCKYS
jgi:hypothetical protein